MNVWLPGPRALLRLPGQAVRAVQAGSALIPQLAELIGELQDLVGEARAVVRDAHATQRQVGATATAVERIRCQVQGIADQAAATADSVAGIAADADISGQRVQALIDRFEPALHTLAPVAEHLAGGVTGEDAAAVVDMIHTAPGLVDKLDTNIVPILDSLDTVAPDLRDVLDVSQGMNEMLGSVPGLSRVKRRIEKDQHDRRDGDLDPVNTP